MSGSNVKFQNRSETLVTFTNSGNLVVPNGVTLIKVLGIGAGAGGSLGLSPDRAGAGDIENIMMQVTPGETVTVTIGAGGAGKTGVSGTGADGGSTIVSTSFKDYHFLGGLGSGPTYSASDDAKRLRYASNGTDNGVNNVGGIAGYEDAGDGGGVSTDGGDGGRGAGGGSSQDVGQSGGDGGDGLVKIWYKFND